jgi:hypothetical protein
LGGGAAIERICVEERSGAITGAHPGETGDAMDHGWCVSIGKALGLGLSRRSRPLGRRQDCRCRDTVNLLSYLSSV